jgi:hypothetical protein
MKQISVRDGAAWRQFIFRCGSNWPPWLGMRRPGRVSRRIEFHPGLSLSRED